MVIEPAADQLTVLTASLFNHGVTTTTRGGTVRLSAHVSTDEETFDMLRAQLRELRFRHHTSVTSETRLSIHAS